MSNGHVDWDILKTTGLSHVLLGNSCTLSFFIFQHLFYVMTKLLISEAIHYSVLYYSCNWYVYIQIYFLCQQVHLLLQIYLLPAEPP